MENILNDLDDLFAKFPFNKHSRLIKNTIVNTMCADYDTLVKKQESPQKAYEIVKNKLADPKTIAKYIPIEFVDYHTLILLIYTIFYSIIYYYTSHPNFLQLFLPVRMEFPIIIAKLIQVTVLCPIFGLIYYHFAKYLPQKYISRTYKQSCICILLATTLYAFYFIASLTFIWHTLSGFSVETITQGFASGLMYFIYDKIISHQWIAYGYSAIIGILFMMSKPLIQCSTKPKEFAIEKVYDFDKQLQVEKTIEAPVIKINKPKKVFKLNLNLQDPPQIKTFFTNLSHKKSKFVKEVEVLKETKVEPIGKKESKQRVNKPRTKTHKAKKRPMMQTKNIVLKSHYK